MTATESRMRRHMRAPRPTTAALSPFVVLVAGVLALIVPSFFGIPALEGNWYNIGQRFAVIALPTLGLGLSMIAGEFDLSVPGAFLLGSVIAVKFGAELPTLWAVIAVVAVGLIGTINGFIVAVLKVDSVAVTLGSYLAMAGLVYVVSDSKNVSFTNFDIGIDLVTPIAGVFAGNLILVAIVVAIIGAGLRFTRWGPELRAIGSDRRSATTVGVKPKPILIAVFALSAAISALAGVLQGYTLAFAQPSTSIALLLSAVTCALIGGIAVTGGIGSVVGVCAGVLAFACMAEALAIVHVNEFIGDVITGTLLFVVAFVTAPALPDQLNRVRHRFGLGRPPRRPL